MQFLVLSQRDTDNFTDDDFAAVLPDETATVRGLYARGVVRQIWLRDDVRGAAFIVEADTREQARSTVDSLPLAKAGMSRFDLIGLSPYGGFGPR